MAASDGERDRRHDDVRRRGRQSLCRRIVLLVSFGLGLMGGLTATAGASDLDLSDAEQLYRTGHYDECAKMAAGEIARGFWSERWAHWKLRSERARGKSSAALATLEDAERRYPASIALRLMGRDMYRETGRETEAATEMNTIERLILSAPYRYATPEGRLSLGRYFRLRGADARKVLDQFYDVATKEEPGLVDAYFATAELALEKQDNALAAETLQKAPKAAAEDPRFHYLLACAFSADNRTGSDKALADALKINPLHVDSLLLQVDHMIDSERYAETEPLLKRVFDVNPREPRAFAYQAVLAHLRNDQTGEAAARGSALAPWAKNPEVDYLIGRELAQKYRFAEGATAQKRALELDPEYLPAKIELCQALLRLGDEAEGWKLAGEIFARDGYNVVAYNLVTLHDRLNGFRTLKDDGFVVRMDAREADLYGERVLALLRRARKTLGAKYEAKLPEEVIVEIFPQKKEFAVRTFGLPGADGLLGVCFGSVITVNSPASQGEDPSNWEAVLWHEFCHVVTLSKTHNKMPRWLSEGISMYEEELENPTWGDALNPRYRAMILGDKLTPLSKLSGAFLTAETPLQLQFAYYESYLSVAFFVQRFGLPALKGLLDDLGAGVPINEALPRQAKISLEELDRDFARFAVERAVKVAPELTWEEPEDLPADADSKSIQAWLEKHPKNFTGLRRLAAGLMTEEKWDRAKEVLEQLKGLYPEYVGAENAYVLLAHVYKRTSDRAGEHKILDELVARDGDASAAYLRLMELDEAAGNWRGVAENARRLLAVNPLIPAPHRQLARAAEHLNERDEAVIAYRALALLDDTDPAEVHYRLAKLLHQSGKPEEARREVLRSLEEAPRFLDAHRLLLELVESGPSQPRAGSPSSPPRPESPIP